MKHLKRFNENKDNFKQELQDFCDIGLAYLMDEGGEIVLTRTDLSPNLIRIKIILDEPKRWIELRDYIIPFLTRLDNKYQINNQPFRGTEKYENDFGTWTSTNNASKVEDIRLYLSFDDDVYTTDLHRNNNGSYMTGQIKDLIADNIGSPNARISDIRLYVKGYKKEKKSILTKIKSFFK